MTIKPPNFYVTTPIYYVNDKPHIGHAYTTILADVLCRYSRSFGNATYFLTGTDEHGQKVAQAAARRGVSPIEHCNTTVNRFRDLWSKLQITNNDFIRTTEARHQKIVSGILQRLFDQGEIYQGDYEGWYCTPCERFFTEKDLEDGNCPDCKRAVEKIAESNYFFRMARHQQWLIDYITDNPDFIQPRHRRNETLGFLRKPLGDLCISRPKSRLPWGIELPFDQDYVCYVWFDALINYISAIKYDVDELFFNKWWPPTYHLIGKDILTTHSVYWPIMLKAIGVPMPTTIFAHGWWLVGRDKMGKSLGNVVDPMAMCDRYGVDAFRYFLVAEMTPGNDASFTEEAFIARYNTDLADTLGNMLNRAVKLVHRHFAGLIPKAADLTDLDKNLIQETLAAATAVEEAIRDMKLDRGIAAVISVSRSCNRYFEQTAPWELAKQKDKLRLGTVLYTAMESLRVISGLLHPVMPDKMELMRTVLGIDDTCPEPNYKKFKEWGILRHGSKIGDIKSLFPRIDGVRTDDDKSIDSAASTGGNKKHDKEKAVETMELVEFSDFTKIKLKTAKVLLAEKVAGADRLLRLEIEVGSDQRQIVAGIAEFYQPEDVIGKTIIIVSNLKPATIRKVESNGMLLAAKDGDKLKLVTVDGDCGSGADVG